MVKIAQIENLSNWKSLQIEKNQIENGSDSQSEGYSIGAIRGRHLDSIADSVFVKIGWAGQIQYQNKRSQ